MASRLASSARRRGLRGHVARGLRLVIVFSGGLSAGTSAYICSAKRQSARWPWPDQLRRVKRVPGGGRSTTAEKAPYGTLRPALILFRVIRPRGAGPGLQALTTVMSEVATR